MEWKALIFHLGHPTQQENVLCFLREKLKKEMLCGFSVN